MYEAGKKPNFDLPIRTEDCVVRKAVEKPIKADAIANHQSRMAR